MIFLFLFYFFIQCVLFIELCEINLLNQCLGIHLFITVLVGHINTLPA